MSLENLDQDALATEEMLKMFEEIAVDDNQDEEIDELVHDMDESGSSEVQADMSEADMEFMSDIEALADIELVDDADAEVLEIADNLDDDDLLEIEPLELMDESEAASNETHNESIEAITDIIDDQSDDDFDLVIEEDDEDDEDEAIEIIEESSENSESTEVVNLPAHSDVVPASTENSLNDTQITDHLQAVVMNAIHALQDWIAIREESHDKKTHQSLAKLDVLLDTVTQQQQHLAEQLSTSNDTEIDEIAQTLEVDLSDVVATNWTDEQWKERVHQLSKRTLEIQTVNAKIRQDLALL